MSTINSTTSTTIDCDTCPVRGRFCGDCFVPLLGRLWLEDPEPPRARPGAPQEAVTQGHQPAAPRPAPVPGTRQPLDTDELAALSAFVRAGLVDPEEAVAARAEVSLASGYAAG